METLESWVPAGPYLKPMVFYHVFFAAENLLPGCTEFSCNYRHEVQGQSNGVGIRLSFESDQQQWETPNQHLTIGPPSWVIGRFSLKMCFLLLIFNLFDASKLCQMCFFRCFREDEKMTTSHLAFQSLCQPRRWRSFSSGGRKPWKQVPHGREPDTLRVSNFEVFFVVSIVSFVSEKKGVMIVMFWGQDWMVS